MQEFLKAICQQWYLQPQTYTHTKIEDFPSFYF